MVPNSDPMAVAVQALTASEAKFRLLFETMAEGWFLAEAVLAAGVAVDWRYLEVNPAYGRLFNRYPEDLVGRTLRSVQPDLPADWLETYRQAAYGIEPVTREGQLGAARRWFEHSLYSPSSGQVACILRDITDQKQVEAARRARLDLFHTAFQSVPVALGITDLATGAMLAGNAMALELFGFTQEEADAGRIKADDLWNDPADRARLVDQVRRTRLVRGQECVMRRKDGSRLWASVSAQVMDLDGREVLLSGALDLTPRKRAEASLRERESLLDIFIQHAPAAMAMLDRDLRYLFATPRWLEEYRIEPQVLVGKRHEDLFPDLPERWKAVHQRALAGAAEACAEDAFTRADGTVDHLRWEVLPWRDADGEVGGIVILSETLNERVAAEAALQTSERRYRRLFEAAPTPYACFSLQDGRTLALNACWHEVFGYRPDEVPDMDAYLDHLYPDPAAHAPARADLAALRHLVEPERSQVHFVDREPTRKEGTRLRVRASWWIQDDQLLVTYGLLPG